MRFPRLPVLMLASLVTACGGGDDPATSAPDDSAGAGGSTQSEGGGTGASGHQQSAGGSTPGAGGMGGVASAGHAGTSNGGTGHGGATAGSSGAGGGATGGSPSAAGGSGSAGKSTSAGGAGTGGKSSGGGGSSGKGTAGAPSGGQGGEASAGTGGSGAGGTAPQGFVHPGVLDQKGQLDFVKSQIDAGKDPWKSALAKTKADSKGKLTYTAQPVPDVACGSYSMNPNVGCSPEKDDSAAAYTHALLWVLTGDEAYAKKSIEIMHAWASTLKSHSASNAPLQSAWSASAWPRAGEIIRYTYSGWSDAGIQEFSAMLRDVYLPEVINGADSNGNWELSMVEATIGIGVFLDDKKVFDGAVEMWKKRVPAYFYLASDGAFPVRPPSGNYSSDTAIVKYWQGQSTFVDGLCQETCRDLGHTQFGLSATLNAAETARIQGVDLFSLEEERLTKTMEFHANFLNGATIPTWLCGGKLAQNTPSDMWELGYNAFHDRLGKDMPLSSKIVAAVRPTGVNHMMVWETLSHAQVGNAGL